MWGVRVRAVVAAFAVTSLVGCAWIERSSVSSSPGAVEGNSSSDRPALSQRGGFVAFNSFADNLVPGDTNGVTDVFVRDHRAHTTERVSVATDESQANGASGDASISDDGRFVAFETDASNLVAGDGDGKSDIVVRDRRLGTTTLVSIDPSGAPIADAAIDPEISGDGRVAAFSVLTPFMSFCCINQGPFVRTLATGPTTLMPNAPGQFNLLGQISLSDDGSRVVYGQLSPVGTDATFGVVVSDTASATIMAHVFSGFLTHQSQGFFDQAISGDGRTVVVTLAAPGAGVGEVHTFDVDQASLVKILDEMFLAPALSDDGTVIALRRADASAYVITAPDGAPPRVVSADAIETPASSVGGTDLSGDGGFVAFVTSDPDMVANDTNGTSDVFTRSLRGRKGP